MKTLEEVKSILKTVYSEYDGIRLGVAGSYARGTQKSRSDIDVVIDGDSMRMDIFEHIKGLFPKVDVIWLDLLEQNDKDMDKFCIDNGLPINDCSAYKTIVKGVIWV